MSLPIDISSDGYVLWYLAQRFGLFLMYLYHAAHMTDGTWMLLAFFYPLRIDIPPFHLLPVDMNPDITTISMTQLTDQKLPSFRLWNPELPLPYVACLARYLFVFEQSPMDVVRNLAMTLRADPRCPIPAFIDQFYLRRIMEIGKMLLIMTRRAELSAYLDACT